jgi:hypothetical protein
VYIGQKVEDFKLFKMWFWIQPDCKNKNERPFEERILLKIKD